MNEEKARADGLAAELERARQADMQRQLDAVARAAQHPPTEVSPKPSQRPGVLLLQAKGLKVGIPLALLVPIVSGLAAGINYGLEFQRQFKAMQSTISGYEARIEKLENVNTDQSAELAKTKVTLAELAGYLTGVLPKAGVNVPGTGTYIQADPLPPGARRPTPVNVRTPVPRPAD